MIGQEITVFRDNAQAEVEAKQKFAKALIQVTDPAMAAALAFPDEPAITALAFSQWQNDPTVQKFINEHYDALSPTARAPGRDAISNEILKLAREARSTDDKLKAYRLWAELMGHITKGNQVSVNNTTAVQTNLFVIPQQPVTPEEEEALELRAIGAQQRLADRAS